MWSVKGKQTAQANKVCSVLSIIDIESNSHTTAVEIKFLQIIIETSLWYTFSGTKLRRILTSLQILLQKYKILSIE